MLLFFEIVQGEIPLSILILLYNPLKTFVKCFFIWNQKFSDYMTKDSLIAHYRKLPSWRGITPNQLNMASALPSGRHPRLDRGSQAAGVIFIIRLIPRKKAREDLAHQQFS